MKKVSANVVKRPRGRPATGMDPVLSGRVPKDLIDRIDRWADANGYTRSESVAKLLEEAITAAEKRAKRKGDSR
jgi:hypothetical protein